jgi:hypothetical protein
MGIVEDESFTAIDKKGSDEADAFFEADRLATSGSAVFRMIDFSSSKPHRRIT